MKSIKYMLDIKGVKYSRIKIYCHVKGMEHIAMKSRRQRMTQTIFYLRLHSPILSKRELEVSEHLLNIQENHTRTPE